MSWPGGPFSYVLHNRDFQVFHAPRGRATRRAASRLRHAPVHQLLLYPDLFYFLTSLSSLSLFLFSASNERAFLAFLPLSSVLPFSLCFILYSQFFSLCRQSCKVRAGNCSSRRAKERNYRGKIPFRCIFRGNNASFGGKRRAFVCNPPFFVFSCFFNRTFSSLHASSPSNGNHLVGRLIFAEFCIHTIYRYLPQSRHIRASHWTMQYRPICNVYWTLDKEHLFVTAMETTVEQLRSEHAKYPKYVPLHLQ